MTAPRVQSRPRFNPADLWEQKVDEGMSEEEATAFVERAMQSEPSDDAPDFSNVESGSASQAVEPSSDNPMLAGYKKAGRLLGNVAQGALFGFGDEIAGAVVGATGARAGGYKNARDAVRAQLERNRRDNPGLAAAAELTGAVVSPLSQALVAARGATLGKTMLSGAKAGAAGGALYGAGSADGDMGDRTAGALAGGAFGGVAGGLTPALIAGAKTAGRIPGALRSATTGHAPAPPQPGTAAADDALDEARQYVVRALERDRVPLTDVGGARAADDPRLLFNLGGRSSGMATRVAQTIPSEATDAVPRAIYGQLEQGPERLLGSVEKAIGKPIPNPITRVAELADEAASAAKPAYEALRNEFVQGQAIEEVMKRPAIKSALNAARTNILNRGEAVPDGATVGLLDDVKKILDDEIESIGEKIAQGKASGADKSGVRSLESARNALVKALDDATLNNPLDSKSGSRYAEARAIAEKGISKREAFREGTKFATARRDRLEAEIPGMTPENQAAYREGAATSIENVVQGTPDRRNLAARLFGSNAEREKLRTAFQGDPKALRMIENAFKQEDQLRQQATAALAPGQSMTTPLREAVEEFRGNIFEDMARSGLWSATKRRALEAYFRAARGMTEAKANEVGRLMTSKPNTALMQELMAARANAIKRAGQRAGVGARAGIATGAISSRAQKP
jgi:hypothetical protein